MTRPLIAAAVGAGVLALAGCGDGDGAGGGERSRITFHVAGGESALVETKAKLEQRARRMKPAVDEITVEGADRLVVSVAGDGAAARRLATAISRPARLVFYDWEANVLGPDGRPAPGNQGVTEQGLTLPVAQERAGETPRSIVVKREQTETGPDTYFVIADRPALEGSEIRNPQQSVDPATREPIVTFEFTPAGRSGFARLTRAVARRGAKAFRPDRPASRAQQHFAIVLDDAVISRPFIDFQQDPDGIDGRTGAHIMGGYTPATARELATLLAIGALPTALTLVDVSAG